MSHVAFCIRTAVIVLAMALLAVTNWRTPLAVNALYWGVNIVACMALYRGWRAGHLSRTPKELFAKARAGQPLTTPLEMIAFWGGLLVLAVIRYA